MIYIKPEPGEPGRRTATRTGELPFSSQRATCKANSSHCIHGTLRSTICLFLICCKMRISFLVLHSNQQLWKASGQKISLCKSTLGPSARDRTRAGYKDMRQEKILQPTQFSNQNFCIWQLEAVPERCFCFFQPLEKAKIHAHYVEQMKNQTEPIQCIHGTLRSTDLLF